MTHQTTANNFDNQDNGTTSLIISFDNGDPTDGLAASGQVLLLLLLLK